MGTRGRPISSSDNRQSGESSQSRTTSIHLLVTAQAYCSEKQGANPSRSSGGEGAGVVGAMGVVGVVGE